MHETLREKNTQKHANYSLLRKLRTEGKITEEFEILISNLSLEEVIGLKLELAAKTTNGMLYGLPLWKSIPFITRDALLKFAISACKTYGDAASFLGIDKSYLKEMLKKYLRMVQLTVKSG